MTDAQLLEIFADIRATQIVNAQLLFAILEKVDGTVPGLEETRVLTNVLADQIENLMRSRMGLEPREKLRQPKPAVDPLDNFDWSSMMEF